MPTIWVFQVVRSEALSPVLSLGSHPVPIFHHPGPGSPDGVAAVYEIGIGMLMMSQHPLNCGVAPVFVVTERDGAGAG